jgi:hypothetical protein
MIEIDHNYINSVSDQYKKRLNKVHGDTNKRMWIDKTGDAKYYNNGYTIFNE